MHVPVEYPIALAEKAFSGVAVLPLLGTITGVVRAVLGLFQMGGACVACLLLLPTACRPGGPYQLRRASGHLLHGLANFSTGILEAIPVVGTLLWIAKAHYINKQKEIWCKAAHIELVSDQEWSPLCGYRALYDHPTSCEFFTPYNQPLLGETEKQKAKALILSNVTEARMHTCTISKQTYQIVEIRPWLVV